jgi:hypothetical protein
MVHFVIFGCLLISYSANGYVQPGTEATPRHSVNAVDLLDKLRGRLAIKVEDLAIKPFCRLLRASFGKFQSSLPPRIKQVQLPCATSSTCGVETKIAISYLRSISRISQN